MKKSLREAAAKNEQWTKLPTGMVKKIWELKLCKFGGSYSIIREGEPFTDGDYVKRCMLKIGQLFDEFHNKDKILQKFQDMPLSAEPVHDRAVISDKLISDKCKI